MGTRGFITFATDGEIEKTVYNHFDSYPTHLGERVMAFVAATLSVDGSTDRVRQQVRDLVAVDESANPSPEQSAALKEAGFWQGVSTGADWYSHLRGTQGDPLAILACGFYADASQFPLDSLFAEWGYVIDFDRSAVEVYEGFQTEPHELGRFAKRQPLDVEASDYGSAKYYPVALCHTVSFEDLADADIPALCAAIEEAAYADDEAS